MKGTYTFLLDILANQITLGCQIEALPSILLQQIGFTQNSERKTDHANCFPSTYKVSRRDKSGVLIVAPQERFHNGY